MASCEKQTAYAESCSEGEKTEIPGEAFAADVMNAKKLVVDDALDQVEDAPPGKHPADQLPTGGLPCFSPRLPKEPETEDDKDPGSRVEEPVRKHVPLHPLQGGRRPTVSAGKHVVPLSNLMKHDAVDEPTEPETQDDAWSYQAGRPFRGRAETFHAEGYSPPPEPRNGSGAYYSTYSMWHEHPPLVLAPSQAKQLYRDHCVASRARKRFGCALQAAR